MRDLKKILIPLAVLVSLSVSSCIPELAIPAKEPLPQTVSEGMARIYFFKTATHRAHQPIFRETDFVAALPPESYVIIEVPAGKHMFMLHHTYHSMALEADMAAGKSYYVYADIGAYAAQLEPITPGSERWDQRQQLMEDLTYVVLNPEKKADIEEAYSEHNQEKLDKARSPEGTVTRMTPEQGE